MNNWWGDLYDNLLADFLMDNRTSEEVEKSLSFIIDKLALEKENLVFDQCCGTGSLSNPLAQKGFRVLGVDQAENYIQRARDRKVSNNAQFIAADAFEFVSNEKCDAGFNWWTSFGYTLDDQFNIKMLQRAADSLKEGALYMLDTMNLPGVLRKFDREVVNRIETPEGEIVLVRETELNWQKGSMQKKWIYLFPNGERRTFNSEVRLYLTHTLVEMFETCGFKVLDIFGSENGEPIQIDSMRCIILARREAK